MPRAVPPGPPAEEIALPMLNPESAGGGNLPAQYASEPVVAARAVAVGVVVFDLDGTILDDISPISHVAADVMREAFGTPPEEGRVHYLATTGMPFEAQLAQLYPESPPELRAQVARKFHQRKIQEAYAHASAFPEMPRVLKQLDRAGWTMVISTGAEREMGEIILEREGLRMWFESVLGSGQGTKREHLVEYQRRYPEARLFLVGDSRFDMEAARDSPGVTAIGRASSVHGWGLSPKDLRRWGAAYADYSLSTLPEALEKLLREPATPRPSRSPRRAARAPGRATTGRAPARRTRRR
ncbi:MAG: HAD hydrolase-like protein [Thermoplasmata archaeon]|nr:HAD hydrolase-like protein [Thermoplasmata archaeon]